MIQQVLVRGKKLLSCRCKVTRNTFKSGRPVQPTIFWLEKVLFNKLKSNTFYQLIINSIYVFRFCGTGNNSLCAKSDSNLNRNVLFLKNFHKIFSDRSEFRPNGWINNFKYYFAINFLNK